MSGGMHLLPMYYTTTSQKKRKAKRVTVKMQSALDAHQKYLKKVHEQYGQTAAQDQPAM